MVTMSLQMIFNRTSYGKVFTKKIEYIQIYTIHDQTYSGLT